MADMGGLRGYAQLQGWDAEQFLADLASSMGLASLKRKYKRPDGTKFSSPWLRQLRKLYQAEQVQAKEGQS